MSHIVVVRGYKPGDELACREMLKQGVMSTVNTAFGTNLVKELTFQVMILVAAILFIFFGIPFTVCLLVVPVVVLITYLATYCAFAIKAMEVDQEVANIPRIYMSNAFSCFWVAEAFEPFAMLRHPRKVHYTIMTEKQFRASNVDVSSQTRRIVGSIALCKSHKVDKGAWLKRLCVLERYRRKGIGSFLVKVAVQFAMDEGYSCANIAATEHTPGGRDLCLRKGFELKHMYYKQILGPLITLLMYEISYRIKSEEDDYCDFKNN